MQAKHITFKRVVVAIGIMSMVQFFPNSIAAKQSIQINLDGKLLTQTKEMGYAYMNQQYGRTMVPLRLVSEEMGYDVKWDSKTQTATIIENGTTVKIAIGSQAPTVNGVTKKIDAPATLKDGRTYVPVRFISEAMGEKVDYKNSTVYIGGENRIPLPEVPAIPGKATYNNDVDFKVIEEYFGAHQFKGASAPVYLDKTNDVAFMVVPHDPEWDKGEPFDVQIKIKGWMEDATIQESIDKGFSDLNHMMEYCQKPKAILKEVLKFYLPNGYEKMYQIIDDGYNGRLSKGQYQDTDLRNVIGNDGKKVIITLDDGVCIRITK
nr:copper amine oxidase N-terminal domain-containing protein [uncultured Niameybacter sp.]